MRAVEENDLRFVRKIEVIGSLVSSLAKRRNVLVVLDHLALIECTEPKPKQKTGLVTLVLDSSNQLVVCTFRKTGKPKSNLLEKHKL